MRQSWWHFVLAVTVVVIAPVSPVIAGDFEYRWGQRFGSSNEEYLEAMAVAGNGDIVIAGRFRDPVDFGGGLLSSTGSDDIFLVKLSASGGHMWSKRFGGSTGFTDVAYGVACDDEGNVVLLCQVSGEADFGGGAIGSGFFPSMCVAKFDPAGAHLWSAAFDDSGFPLTPSDVAISDGGSVAITGGYVSPGLDLGGGPLGHSGNAEGDAFIAVLGPTGLHQWSVRIGAQADCNTPTFVFCEPSVGEGVCFDSDGNLYVTGQEVVSASEARGFIRKYGPDGSQMWGNLIANWCPEDALAVDALGNVYVASAEFDSVDLGGGMLPSRGGVDIVLGSFSSNGAHRWSSTLGGSSWDSPASLAWKNGILQMSCGIGTVVDFGCGGLGDDAEAHWAIVHFDELGSCGGGYSFPSSAPFLVLPPLLDRDAAGGTVLAGIFGGELELAPGASLLASGTFDIFVARFGASGFEPVLIFPASGEPVAEASADLDNDGDLDLVTIVPSANPLIEGVYVYINLGVTGDAWNGYDTPTRLETGADPSSLALADVNNDTHIDIIVTNAGDNDISVFTNDGNANFTRLVPDLPIGVDPISVGAGDIDGDGNVDLIVGLEGPGQVVDAGGAGDGSFGPIGVLATSPRVKTILPQQIDEDKDGRIDIAFVDADLGIVGVLIQNNMGFLPPIQLPVGAGPDDLAMEDLDGNGFKDFVTANLDDGTVSVILNQNGTMFDPATSIEVGDAARAIDVGDINGDGAPDLIVAADDLEAGASLKLIENNSDGTFGAPVTLDTSADPNDVIAVDVNGDGAIDLVAANADLDAPSGGSIGVLLNDPPELLQPGDLNGDGVLNFNDVLEVLVAWGPCVGCPADINGDGEVNFSDLLIILSNWS